MPADTEKVKSALLKKGFELQESHHLYFTYRCGKTNKLTHISTKISHGNRKQIPDNILSKMAQQMHISRRDLNSFVDCCLKRVDYQNLIEKII